MAWERDGIQGIADELEKRAALRDRGIVGREEFQAQTASVLVYPILFEEPIFVPLRLSSGS